MNQMLLEIEEQPKYIEKALELGREPVARLVSEMHSRGVGLVIVAARGTSDNAATYAKYLLEIVAGLPVALAAPSVLTLYDARMRLDNALVMGISQSGQGADVVQVLSAARAAGAMTACVTNEADSAITRVSDHVLLCHAGKEKAVAATKTYTTSIALVALLVARYANRTDLLEELLRIPDTVQKMLSLKELIQGAVERYRYMQECAVLARGVNQATALEAALKITETSYVVSKPYSGADFLHGPIAMVSEGFPCIVFAPDGLAYASQLDLALKLKERGAELIVIARDKEMLELGRTRIPVPVDGIPELLSPLPYIIPAQLFACYLSLTRGLDPDRPRGLSKVTITR